MQLAAADAPRDFVTNMGVSDANLPAKRDAAIAAVKAADAAGAHAAAEALAASLASAPDAGRGRLFAILGSAPASIGGLVALFLAMVFMCRRRDRTRAVGALPTAAAAPCAPVDTSVARPLDAPGVALSTSAAPALEAQDTSAEIGTPVPAFEPSPAEPQSVSQRNAARVHHTPKETT